MPFNTLYTLYIKCKTVDSFLRIKQTLEFHMTWSVRKLSKHELHFLFPKILHSFYTFVCMISLSIGELYSLNTCVTLLHFMMYYTQYCSIKNIFRSLRRGNCFVHFIIIEMSAPRFI